jgi:hypothetical protein
VVQDHDNRPASIRIQAVQQSLVPKGREGKHKRIVSQILRQLDRLPLGTALKIALNSLPDTKARTRAALIRAAHQRGVAIATSSDSSDLYVWKSTGKS